MLSDIQLRATWSYMRIARPPTHMRHHAQASAITPHITVDARGMRDMVDGVHGRWELVLGLWLCGWHVCMAGDLRALV